MTPRMRVGQIPVRRLRPQTLAAVVMVALLLAIGPGAVRSPATLAEGDDTTTGEPAPPDPAPTIEPAPAEPTPIPEPTATTPPTETPPTVAPIDVPTATPEPTPDEGAIADQVTPEPTPTPTEAPADGIGQAQGEQQVRSADESVALGTVTCTPASGASETIAQGAAGDYDCVYRITIAPIPGAFAAMDLEWAISAQVDPGWSADLRHQDETGDAAEQDWTPGAAPGLVVVDTLTGGDDADGVLDDGSFVHVVHFGLRLSAPVCGGPTDPTVTLTPTALSEIDAVPGTRIQGEPIEPIHPTLAVVAPGPTLVRRTTGALDDPGNPLRFSHADQVVDAGTMSLTVTSAYCGGWNVSMNATDFTPAGEGVGFGAEHLVLTGIDPGAGAPAPAASSFHMSNDVQSVVSAPNQSLAAGTYAYDLNLELTIPGGTPPGTYTSTVTITTSAAP